MADNDNNKLMTGELFEIEENKLRVVSLDGHRISVSYTHLDVYKRQILICSSSTSLVVPAISVTIALSLPKIGRAHV